MSTPMSHAPLAPLRSRRLTWFLVAGLAIAGLTVALVLALSSSSSPSPVRAVAAPAAASPALSAGSQAAPYRSRFDHGMPSLNPEAKRAIPQPSSASKVAPTHLRYYPGSVLRKEGLDRRTGR